MPLDQRVERDLVDLSARDPVNGLPGVLVDWLRDDAWIVEALQIPSVERRAWLAQVGASAFDRDRGGYASFLRQAASVLDFLWNDEHREVILRRHTQWLFVNLSDILDFRRGVEFQPGASEVNWEGVSMVGAEHFRAALDAGRGVIVLSVHQSHPGFGFFHPTWSDVPLSTVANLGDRGAPHGSLLLDGLRDRVEILPTTAAALRPMLARLSAGGCVAIYGDYLYPGTPGTVTSLLGGTVLVASAAVALALRTGAAVLPVSVARSWPPESNQAEMRIAPALGLAQLDPRDPQSHSIAALFFGVAIEGLIRRNPSVWRLWATLPSRWRLGREAADTAAAAT